MKEHDRGRGYVFSSSPLAPLFFSGFFFLAWAKSPFQSYEAKLHRLQQGEREMEWRKRDKGGRGREKVAEEREKARGEGSGVWWQRLCA